MIISIKPILAPATPRRNFKQAHWEAFKEDRNATIHNPHAHIDLHPTDIDTQRGQWYAAIKSSLDTHFPTTHYKTPPCTNFSHQTNVLRVLLTAISEQAAEHGWTPHSYDLYGMAKANPIVSLKDHQRHWNALTEKSTSLLSEPAAFWFQVKNLMGNDHSRAPYLTKPGGEKMHTNAEEAGFREIWEIVGIGCK